MNFLYCLDENYNIQSFISILSLLENCNEKINLFIIHKNPKSFSKYISKIENHQSLNKIQIYKFKSYANFPNLDNVHVSEATYYRLYIEDYIKDEIDSIVYLDGDTVILKNITEEFIEIITKLKRSEYIISVKPEFVSDDHLQKLRMKSSEYFNAGVMFIDFKKWSQSEICQKLQIIQKEIYESINFWDQDVLNSFFDGKYLSLDENNNFKVDVDDRNQTMIPNSVNLIHYMGKSKPWTVRGVLNPNSTYYQEIYRDYFSLPYHISTNWKMQAYNDLITIMKNSKNYQLENKFGLILSVFYFLIKKRGK